MSKPYGNYEFMLEIEKRCKTSDNYEWSSWLLEQLIIHRTYLNKLTGGDI